MRERENESMKNWKRKRGVNESVSDSLLWFSMFITYREKYIHKGLYTLLNQKREVTHRKSKKESKIKRETEDT